MSNRLVTFLLVLFVAVSVFGGGNQEAATEDTGGSTSVGPLPGAFGESPMLSELVKAGELPPVEERLPKEPGYAIDVPETFVDLEIGEYGGTLRQFHTSPGSDPYVFCMDNEPILRMPGLAGDFPIRGNIVKEFEMSADQKTFTFYMREGMKWSDGIPLTTEDVRFAYEDVILNTDLTPGYPQWMRSGNAPTGEPLKLEIVNDYTFKISFATPYGGFPVQLAIAGWHGYNDLMKPKHFLVDYHVDYTPLEKLEPKIAELELTEGEWWTLFNTVDQSYWEIIGESGLGFPRLTAWIPLEHSLAGVTLERNPYYFKIDKAGNQLPYIDTIRTDLVQDGAASLLKILSGEIDFVSGGAQGASVKDIPLLNENAKSGGYRVVLNDMHVTPADISFNYTYEDPVWRELVGNIKFRQALNFAINRNEIIDAVYFGFAELPTATANEYSPDKANALLDELGMSKRGTNGMRLGPDGKPFNIVWEVAEVAPDIPVVAELVAEYWMAVGIDVLQKRIESGLWSQMRDANELKVQTMWSSLTLYYNYQPFFWGDVNMGQTWKSWIQSGGETGEEPMPAAKEFLELVDLSMGVPQEEALEIRDQYIDILRDNLLYLITVEHAKYPTVVANNIGNVPHSGYSLNTAFGAEQFFYSSTKTYD